MKRGVRRKPYKFVCQSKRTDLRIHIGQIIKVRGVKYEVVPELREKVCRWVVGAVRSIRLRSVKISKYPRVDVLYRTINIR